MKFEILMDKKENPRKCTILPLKGREDFHIRYFKGSKAVPAFSAQVLLHIDGEDISQWKGSVDSIALIDCTWRKVGHALQIVEKPLPQLVRIPEGFITAYPRKNKEGNDPEAGLATIEALFICAAFLGNWDETLLDKYHFKEDFLKKNQPLWEKFQLGAYAK